MDTKTAVILVAGVGERLRPLTNDRPKALMELGGETILGRAIRLLTAHGVQEIVLATGYREDQIRRKVQDLGVKIELVPNPEYQSTQNSVSLLACRRALADKSFFKLDGDVVFRSEVLTRLANSSAPLSVATDASRSLDEEAMKVRIEAGRIRAFGKHLEQAHAETIGVECLSASAGVRVFDAIERAVAAGQKSLYYEDFYSELIRADELDAEAVDVSDLPWAEVDTPEDLERARELVLRS